MINPKFKFKSYTKTIKFFFGFIINSVSSFLWHIFLMFYLIQDLSEHLQQTRILLCLNGTSILRHRRELASWFRE